MTHYPRIAALLFGPPLAIQPAALRTMIDAIGPRLLGTEDEDQDRPRAEADPDQGAERRAALHQRLAAVTDGEVVDVGDGIAEYCVTAGGVAVIPVQGTLVNRFDWLSTICGITSYDGIGMALDAALADAKVKAVLLDIDSPGGQANVVADLADRIRAACAAKPVWAVANPMAFSAAYWLAAAADRVLLPRLGDVGSIGALRLHTDRSKANAQRGIAYTAVYSGARKVDGASHAPLTTAAQETWQADIDQVRQHFAAAVAGFRGLSVEAVLATEAGQYMDVSAIAAGLADAVMTFDEALSALTDQVSRAAAPLYFQRGLPSPAARASGQQEVPMAGSPAAPPPDKSEAVDNSGPAVAGLAVETVAAADPGAVMAAAQAYVRDVSDLCLLAGRPEAAADFMAKGLSPDQVRQALIDAKATSSASAALSAQRPAEGAVAAQLALDHKGVFARFNKQRGS
ncbi:MAG: S49 family peptidase [Magnetospirillum sp.]|nr:S49 family peptidase [Magnetospirillum sp.]